MKRKVLIEKKENHVWTFFLEEDQIAEIHCAKSDEQEKVHQIGDIYVAKVQNIVQNIGAAFLEIEPGVNCYFDLRDAQNAFFTHKIGKKPLCIGDELVVQISREAVKTKVPTVTGNISLTGRYAVLTHGNTRIGVSSKISKKDREAYKERLQEYQNDQYGLIIRTNAKDAAFEDVLTEIEQLKAEYEHLLKYAASRVCFSCLKSAPPSYITDLKNVYMDGMEEILVNDAEIYEKICSYFKKEMPVLREVVTLQTAKPLGTYLQDYNVNTPAITENAYGKGKAYYVAVQPDLEFLKEFLGDVIEEANVEANLTETLPYGVTVSKRSGKEQKDDVYFLQNFNRHPVKMVLNECYTNLITDEILTGSIKLQTYQCIVMQKK